MQTGLDLLTETLANEPVAPERPVARNAAALLPFSPPPLTDEDRRALQETPGHKARQFFGEGPVGAVLGTAFQSGLGRALAKGAHGLASIPTLTERAGGPAGRTAEDEEAWQLLLNHAAAYQPQTFSEKFTSGLTAFGRDLPLLMAGGEAAGLVGRGLGMGAKAGGLLQGSTGFATMSGGNTALDKLTGAPGAENRSVISDAAKGALGGLALGALPPAITKAGSALRSGADPVVLAGVDTAYDAVVNKRTPDWGALPAETLGQIPVFAVLNALHARGVPLTARKPFEILANDSAPPAERIKAAQWVAHVADRAKPGAGAKFLGDALPLVFEQKPVNLNLGKDGLILSVNNAKLQAALTQFASDAAEQRAAQSKTADPFKGPGETPQPDLATGGFGAAALQTLANRVQATGDLGTGTSTVPETPTTLSLQFQATKNKTRLATFVTAANAPEVGRVPGLEFVDVPATPTVEAGRYYFLPANAPAVADAIQAGEGWRLLGHVQSKADVLAAPPDQQAFIQVVDKTGNEVWSSLATTENVPAAVASAKRQFPGMAVHVAEGSPVPPIRQQATRPVTAVPESVARANKETAKATAFRSGQIEARGQDRLREFKDFVGDAPPEQWTDEIRAEYERGRQTPIKSYAEQLADELAKARADRQAFAEQVPPAGTDVQTSEVLMTNNKMVRDYLDGQIRRLEELVAKNPIEKQTPPPADAELPAATEPLPENPVQPVQPVADVSTVEPTPESPPAATPAGKAGDLEPVPEPAATVDTATSTLPLWKQSRSEAVPRLEKLATGTDKTAKIAQGIAHKDSVESALLSGELNKADYDAWHGADYGAYGTPKFKQSFPEFDRQGERVGGTDDYPIRQRGNTYRLEGDTGKDNIRAATPANLTALENKARLLTDALDFDNQAIILSGEHQDMGNRYSARGRGTVGSDAKRITDARVWALKALGIKPELALTMAKDTLAGATDRAKLLPKLRALYAEQVPSRVTTAEDFARALVAHGLRSADGNKRITLADARLLTPVLEDMAKRRGIRLADVIAEIATTNPADAEKRFGTEARGVKGAAIWDDPETLGATLHLIKGADVSTVVHEYFHAFYPFLTGAEVGTLWNNFRQSVGTASDLPPWARGTVSSLDELRAVAGDHGEGVHHKAFKEWGSRAFEAYWREGRAPTSQLAAVFEKMKIWLTTIYQSVKGSSLDVGLNDETRQLFDRLLGKEDAGSADQSRSKVKPPLTGTNQSDRGLPSASNESGALMKTEAPPASAKAITAESDAGAATPGSVKAPVKESKPGEVNDFGETLGGARKDRVPSVAKEISDGDLATMSFSEIWPKGEVDAIENPDQAALATALRSVIPAKPRMKYKVQRWVEQVKLVRTLMQYANEHGFDAVMAKMNEGDYQRSLGGFRDKINLLRQLPRTEWDRIGRVENYPDAYRYEKDADGKLQRMAVPYASAEVDGRSVTAPGLDALRAKVAERLGTDAESAGMQFEIRSPRNGAGAFINKKGDPLYRKLKEFTGADAVAQARAFLKQNRADLAAAWDAVKQTDNVKETDVRGDTNRPRTAKDYRQGKDVTPEMFQDAFGFRGVEFGNWVEQGTNRRERQGMLNEAYDALHDLSEIIGVPPKALSLNGELGLGFGSRGSGRASAHYEPGKIVINLTKTRGAGTLAHEWFHALDHYFQRQRTGQESKVPHGGNMITYQPEAYYEHGPTGQRLSATRFAQVRVNNPAEWRRIEGVRPEVEQAFTDLVKALNDSPMNKRSQLIDAGKSGGYWSRVIERAARSFENYVIAKMMQQGYHNDYLANVVGIENFQRDAGRYPYLLDTEIKPVAEAFDKLFDTLQTRETEKGVALFQGAEPKREEESKWSPRERRAALEHMPAVAIDTKPLGDLRDIKGVRSAAWRLWEKLRGYVTENRWDGREIQVGRSGFEEISQHSPEPSALSIVPQLRQILRDAVPLWTETDVKDSDHPDVKAWHYYGTRINLDGSEAYALMLVREQKDGSFLYDNHVTSASIIQKGLRGQPLPGVNRAEDQTSLSKNKLFQWWHGVKEAEQGKSPTEPPISETNRAQTQSSLSEDKLLQSRKGVNADDESTGPASAPAQGAAEQRPAEREPTVNEPVREPAPSVSQPESSDKASARTLSLEAKEIVDRQYRGDEAAAREAHQKEGFHEHGESFEEFLQRIHCTGLKGRNNFTIKS